MHILLELNFRLQYTVNSKQSCWEHQKKKRYMIFNLWIDSSNVRLQKIIEISPSAVHQMHKDMPICCIADGRFGCRNYATKSYSHSLHSECRYCGSDSGRPHVWQWAEDRILPLYGGEKALCAHSSPVGGWDWPTRRWMYICSWSMRDLAP